MRRTGWRSSWFLALTLAGILAVLTQSSSPHAVTVTLGDLVGEDSPTAVRYSRAPSALGGTAPYAWSATGLPPGLTIDAATGLISGVPTTRGEYPATLTATDRNGTAGSMSFTLQSDVRIADPGSPQGWAAAPLTSNEPVTVLRARVALADAGSRTGQLLLSWMKLEPAPEGPMSFQERIEKIERDSELPGASRANPLDIPLPDLN